MAAISVAGYSYRGLLFTLFAFFLMPLTDGRLHLQRSQSSTLPESSLREKDTYTCKGDLRC